MKIPGTSESKRDGNSPILLKDYSQMKCEDKMKSEDQISLLTWKIDYSQCQYTTLSNLAHALPYKLN